MPAWALGLLLGLTGGELAGACQYPSVVSFRGFDTKCTGTLVHPDVVVTAAHCLEDTTGIRVRFGEAFSPRERIVDSVACSMHPEYLATRSAAHDIGVCRLAEAVDDVPVTPLAVGCELDALQPGVAATIVGFGITPEGDPFGSKRAVATTIARGIADDGTIAIGSATVGGCEGDSGGPALVHYGDGVWRVAAVSSTNPACGTGPGRFVTVRDHVAWLEQAAERDLTPCHDGDGMFVGGSTCAGFEADPLDVADAWAEGCRGALADPTEHTCAPQAGSSGSEPEPSSSSSGDPDGDARGSGCTCTTGAPPLLLAMFVGMLRRRSR